MVRITLIISKLDTGSTIIPYGAPKRMPTNLPFKDHIFDDKVGFKMEVLHGRSYRWY